MDGKRAYIMRYAGDRVGFIQGRLSEMIDGKIQAFPWSEWREEFPRAESIDLRLMEWTLDQERLHENPLMTREGQQEIHTLSEQHGVRVVSLTGDCFMQAPFWKAPDGRRDDLLQDFRDILRACQYLDISYIVVPLVDNGSVENEDQMQILLDGMASLEPLLSEGETRIVFESDYAPADLEKFIKAFPATWFGINYDIGNSAALGYDPEMEIAAYHDRIWNVHVKDRILHGTTVPLGTGDADIPSVFRALAQYGYSGNYILQTARADDGDHLAALMRYRNMTVNWINSSET